MWKYIKKLEYPVNIQKKDLNMAKALMAQYGGPDGELAASLRYINQRYNMPDGRGKALLTDIGTEELAHIEIIAAMVHQLLKDATVEELKQSGLTAQFIEHDHALFPVDAAMVPFTSTYIETTGDWDADLVSDMAAEKRAKVTYEHLIDLASDEDVIQPLLFLRQREVVHYQRFKELREYYKMKYQKKDNQ